MADPDFKIQGWYWCDLAESWASHRIFH